MNESTNRRTPPAGEGPRATNPYATVQNRAMISWKQRTAALPDDARLPGEYAKHRRTYPFCLPAEYASHNLLPAVREGAIELFKELRIAWHDSVSGGPSNHMRDSQVQCVNALYAMVADPERIRRAFSHVVDITEVLPIEGDRFLTFEYIGPTDYFGEGVRNGVDIGRRRGVNCTSVDAAFRYRTSEGAIELALVEWKFTEAYLTTTDREPKSDAVRISRYQSDLQADDGPVRADVLPMELLLDEPFYQLVRQQLLAHRLEAERVLEADVVRVLHVLAPANTGYQLSLPRTQHQAIGASVDEVWSKLLRASNRFAHVDPMVFLDPAITSVDYVDRYGAGPVDDA